MIVYTAFRPEDQVILGVFSSEDKAEKYQKYCFNAGRDIQISDHKLDEELAYLYESDEVTRFDFDNQGWMDKVKLFINRSS